MRKEIIGDAALYLGDCLEILPILGEVDVVITDPPYGVDLSGKKAKKRGGGATTIDGGYASFNDTEDNIKINIIPRFEGALLLAGRAAITPGVRCMMLYPRPTDVGCFYSAAGTGMTSWGFSCSQPIFFYGKCPYLARGKGSRANSCGQTYPNDANETGHPCAKPVRMMNWLVNRASWEDETVLDPFMGSGTTGVACMNLGRKFIGIEIEPKYFDISCERIEQAQKQGRLFG